MSSASIPFDELQEHAAFVRALARSLVRDDASADDAVQETWLAAVKSPPRQEGKERSWLSKVVRNATRQQRRSAGRRSHHERAAARPDSTGATEELAARDEIFRNVSGAVLGLPDEYRAVVMLRFYDGLPPRKIAAKLGLPVETVRTRQKRALGRLRQELDGMYGDDREAWKAALLPLAGLSWTSMLAGSGLSFQALVAAAVVAAAVTAAFVAWPAQDGSEETAPAGESRETPPMATWVAPPRDDGPVLFGARGAAHAGTGTVAGRVLHLQTGAPVEGARIVFVPTNGGSSPEAVVTDVAGRFLATGVPAGRRFGIRIESIVPGERRIPAFEVPAGRLTDLGTLWIGARGRIEGRVVDRRGASIADAGVAVYPGTYPFSDFPPLPDEVLLGLDRASEALARARSGTDGAFVLEDITSGPLTLVVTAPGFGQAVRRLVMTREGLTEDVLTVTVVESAPILGVVLDAAARGVGGARVALLPDSGDGIDFYARQFVTSDAAGRFRFDAPPRAVSYRAAVATAGRPTRVERFDGNVRSLRLVLGGAAVLRARLVDASTELPIEGARLLVTTGQVSKEQPTGGHVASARTDAAGQVELWAEPGRLHLLVVKHPVHGMVIVLPARQGMPSALDLGTHADGRLQEGVNDWLIRLRPGGRIEGRVTDVAGLPIGGASCRVMGPHGVATAVTDAEGRYEISGRGTGPNLFTVEAPGYVQPEDSRLLMGSGTDGVHTHDVTMDTGATATGRVVDEEGRPVVGAEVQVLPADPPLQFAPPPKVDGTLTNEEGRYVFHALMPGKRYTVVARATRRVTSAGTPFAVGTSGPAEAPDLVLLPGARVRVRAVTPTGAPLPDAYLRIQVRRGATPNVLPEDRPDLVTDADGLAEVVDLPVGSVSISASHVDHGPGTLEIEISDAEASDSPFDVRLTFAARLTGIVLDAEGGPIASATVVATAGADEGETPCGGTFTDASGRFSLENLPGEGRYRLRVLAPGHETSQGVADTGDEAIEFRLSPRSKDVEARLENLIERAAEFEQGMREAEGEPERRRLQERFKEWMEEMSAATREGGTPR